jgi:hypothetical protein
MEEQSAKDSVGHRFSQFNSYSEYLSKEALEGFGDFKIWRQIIRLLQYADDLAAG